MEVDIYSRTTKLIPILRKQESDMTENLRKQESDMTEEILGLYHEPVILKMVSTQGQSLNFHFEKA